MIWNPIYNPPKATDIYIVRSSATLREFNLLFSMCDFKWRNPENSTEYHPLPQDQWKAKL